jgi:hypothetical protein
MKYVPPVYDLSAFNCPHCNAYSAMKWVSLDGLFPNSRYWTSRMKLARCTHCNADSYWFNESAPQAHEAFGRMVVPAATTAPLPHGDMPADMRADFEEARLIAPFSPRGAAALLRLSIQKLCRELGEKGDNINADIAALVAKGLSPQLQQALDVVRVVGNNAVHPGELSADDVSDVCNALFALINHIVDEMIARPKKITALYESLPVGARSGIVKRDQKSP